MSSRLTSKLQSTCLPNMTTYKLHLENSCHENWNEMKPEEKGKFCESCSKTVIDFSRSSIQEVFRFMKTKEEHTCGRFTKEQMDQVFVEKQNHPWIQPYVGSISLLSMLFTPNFSNAQNGELIENTKDTDSSSFIIRDADSNIEQLTASDSLILKGYVQDSIKERMPFCPVRLYRDSVLLNSSTSNYDGEFTFKIPQSMRNDSLRLVTTYIGYKSLSQNIVPSQTPKDLELTIDSSNMILGGAYFVKNTPWTRFKRLWRR